MGSFLRPEFIFRNAPIRLDKYLSVSYRHSHMARLSKAQHVGRSILTVRLEWYPEDRKLVDSLRHGAKLAERTYQQHAKFLIRRAMDTGLDRANGDNKYPREGE